MTLEAMSMLLFMNRLQWKNKERASYGKSTRSLMILGSIFAVECKSIGIGCTESSAATESMAEVCIVLRTQPRYSLKGNDFQQPRSICNYLNLIHSLSSYCEYLPGVAGNVFLSVSPLSRS